MADTHAHDAHDDHGPQLGAYMAVFLALAFFTGISFVFYSFLPPATSATLIMIVAVIKAFLVGLVFMHLKYDWPKLYFLIMPCFILAAMMVVVLLPDIVLAWHHDPGQPVIKKTEKPH